MPTVGGATTEHIQLSQVDASVTAIPQHTCMIYHLKTPIYVTSTVRCQAS